MTNKQADNTHCKGCDKEYYVYDKPAPSQCEIDGVGLHNILMNLGVEELADYVLLREIVPKIAKAICKGNVIRRKEII